MGYSRSLERDLAILSAFRPDRPLLGISELGRQLGLNRSTTHRYAATLAGLGYLLQDPATRKYRLGPRVLHLGFSVINSMELREIATPHLQELSGSTGHTVNMAILDGDDIVYIERVRCSQPGQREIDLNLHVGSRLPAYCTSMGKVLLAHLPDAERAAVVGRVRLARRGPNTLTGARSSPKTCARSLSPCVPRPATPSPPSTWRSTARWSDRGPGRPPGAAAPAHGSPDLRPDWPPAGRPPLTRRLRGIGALLS
ncbi:MAG TPA: IclR family transcriptional regulator [Gaiellales bacterium]|nr:IclR family transcriptional regulator [Gaiellales bacterium]